MTFTTKSTYVLKAVWSMYQGKFQTWLDFYIDGECVASTPSMYFDDPSDVLKHEWVTALRMESGVEARGRYYPKTGLLKVGSIHTKLLELGSIRQFDDPEDLDVWVQGTEAVAKKIK